MVNNSRNPKERSENERLIRKHAALGTCGLP